MSWQADIADGQVRVNRWDVGTLAWIPWDGSLTAGALTIGAITNTAFAVTKTPLTASAPTVATVGASSAQAVASNANRKGLILINTHASQRISLAFGATAVLDSGITLFPNGGSYNMGEYDFTTAAVNAIASGAGTPMTVQEYE